MLDAYLFFDGGHWIWCAISLMQEEGRWSIDALNLRLEDWSPENCSNNRTWNRVASTCRRAWPVEHYSHSMVAGGLLEMSRTTRLIPCTSLQIRFEILARISCGGSIQFAVMPSVDSTILSAAVQS